MKRKEIIHWCWNHAYRRRY